MSKPFNLSIIRRDYSTSTNTSHSNAPSHEVEELKKIYNLDPIFIFEDLDTNSTKEKIQELTKGLSGIYLILNKSTGNFYIGSASTNRFYKRFYAHLISYKGSKRLKLAVKDFKLKNFAFLVLELFPEIITVKNNKELMDIETKYIRALLPSYNILTEAGSSFGYKHTEEDKKRMSENYSDERRKLIGDLNRGKKFSAETIELMRQSALKRAPMTEQTKLKCITHVRPVTLFNKNGTVFGSYSTIKEAAFAINCNEKTVRRALKSPKQIIKRR